MAPGPTDNDLPDELRDRLAHDPDARAERYVVVAYPLPDSGLDWIQHRFRLLAEQEEAARGEANESRRILASLNDYIATLHRSVADLTERER